MKIFTKNNCVNKIKVRFKRNIVDVFEVVVEFFEVFVGGFR